MTLVHAAARSDAENMHDIYIKKSKKVQPKLATSDGESTF